MLTFILTAPILFSLKRGEEDGRGKGQGLLNPFLTVLAQ